MSARLLVDAGNSRLKWAIAHERGWADQGDLDYEALHRLADVLPQTGACFVASVTGDAQERALRSQLDAAGVPATWLTAAPRFGDLVNGYSNPAQLGVDRWMAAIAAHARAQRPLLVVSVGTAMTVDGVSRDGTFLGGIIVPGPTLMREAIAQKTARVDAGDGTWRAFPTNSADAVHSGIVAALAGAVLLQHQKLVATEGEALCFLTGGGAELLQPHLPVAAEWIPNLVLEGIDLVSRERAPT